MTDSLKEISTRAPAQLGAVIRRLRKAKGLTQLDLAKKSGVQQRTISKIENGQKNTEISTIYSICAALELDLVVSPRGQKRSKKPHWLEEA